MMKDKMELTKVVGYKQQLVKKSLRKTKLSSESKQIAISNRFTSLRYLQESSV
jgi:hypothetical protein